MTTVWLLLVTHLVFLAIEIVFVNSCLEKFAQISIHHEKRCARYKSHVLLLLFIAERHAY